MKNLQKDKIIRDLSWLSFNERVLQEAQDATVHPYDRLKFLGIFSNNQDEFFRVRVAALSKMVELGKKAKMHLEDNPDKILDEIQSTVLSQSLKFDLTYLNVIKELKARNIYLKTPEQLTKAQLAYVLDYFESKVRTRIVPLMIDSIPEMPLLKDKSIYLACVLSSTSSNMVQRYSLIEVPARELSRFLVLPPSKGHHDIILLEDIIRIGLPNIFGAFGFDQFVGYVIKVTRDAEFDLDNDINSNLISQLEKGIKNRKKGKATRFIYDRTIDPSLLKYLTQRLGLGKTDNLSPGGRIHNFKDFMDFPDRVFSDIQPRKSPLVHPLLIQPCRIMHVLEERDVLLSFPYHSFNSLIDLLSEAAIDPAVKSIKITCYRLAKDSRIANALINAVRNGKEVTAFVELKARFDEEANLKWKNKFDEEGVKVLFTIPNMKVHGKLCVITKREFDKERSYGFISTGNFNESTARFYGDHCLLTTDKGILSDINKIFQYLSDSTQIAPLKSVKELPVSPLTMRSTFLSLIDNEIKNAKSGKPASVIFKMNSLVDDILINKLYEAAATGVDIKLIVRGICCVQTKRKEFKKSITAISIVDEYLEHARVLVAYNAGEPAVYISSADWMVRNLDHRVEAAVAIKDPVLKQELIDILNIQLAENVKARILDNDQKNKYKKMKENEIKVRSQEAIYEYLSNKTYLKTVNEK